ncbi:hypothetical protein [Lacinutrix salivirga]
MQSQIFDILPNLESFDYQMHYDSLFINQKWVLVNGIVEKKAVYVFKDENILTIKQNDTNSETSWCIDFKNTFSIETEDGLITVKAYFKDDDVLVLDREDNDGYALFINESTHETGVNSIDDVRAFLREKYKKKATSLIYEHQFYYISESEEFGPCTVEELATKVKADTISEHCFVRDINEYDYSKRLRIRDLTKEL